MVLSGIFAMGFPLTDSIRGQQGASSTYQEQSESAKTCILVLGAVRSPARIDFQSIRLKEAIQMVGGATESASGAVHVIHSSSTLTCPSKEGQRTVPAMRDSLQPTQSRSSMDFYILWKLYTEEAEANPLLQPGDLVVVVEAPPIYVTGQVYAPQGLYLKDHLTLTQAIAMAGGILTDGNPKKVRILRHKGRSVREVIIIDLNAIRKHKKIDLVLKPYDVIEVPERDGGRRKLFDSHLASSTSN